LLDATKRYDLRNYDKQWYRVTQLSGGVWQGVIGFKRNFVTRAVSLLSFKERQAALRAGLALFAEAELGVYLLYQLRAEACHSARGTRIDRRAHCSLAAVSLLFGETVDLYSKLLKSHVIQDRFPFGASASLSLSLSLSIFLFFHLSLLSSLYIKRCNLACGPQRRNFRVAKFARCSARIAVTSHAKSRKYTRYVYIDSINSACFGGWPPPWKQRNAARNGELVSPNLR